MNTPGPLFKVRAYHRVGAHETPPPAVPRRGRAVRLPGARPVLGRPAPGRHGERRPPRREPDRPAGQPGRHAPRRAGGAAGPASPGARPVAGRRHPDHRRQDGGARGGGPGHRLPSASGCRCPKTTYAAARPRRTSCEPDKDGQLSYTGLRVLPGRPARVPERRQRVGGRVRRGGRRHDPRRALDPSSGGQRPPPPGGDPGRPRRVARTAARLYVCGNLSNTLLELAVADGRVLRTFDVGVAPYDVVLSGGKAYVSNWGGRRPRPGELTGPAGRGTEVKVDPVKHVASEGSVTVIDLESGKARAEIVTGLHASALAVSPDGRHVVCANAASDTLSVIDTRTDAVVETIWAKPSPADLFGAQPNALAFDPDRPDALRRERHPERRGRRRLRPGRARVEAAGPHPGGLVPRRPRLRRATPDAPRRQHQGPRRPPEAVRGRGRSSRRHGIQLAPLPRLALPRAGARGPRAPRPQRDGVAQPPPRAHRGGAPAAAPRPARPRRARAHRRAEPDQARRLRHQGEPHVRPGAGRRRERATGTRACASSASGSPPTSTSSCASSCCSTTPTAPAS